MSQFCFLHCSSAQVLQASKRARQQKTASKPAITETDRPTGLQTDNTLIASPGGRLLVEILLQTEYQNGHQVEVLALRRTMHKAWTVLTNLKQSATQNPQTNKSEQHRATKRVCFHTARAVKHVPNVETHVYCPQVLLSLDFKRKMTILNQNRRFGIENSTSIWPLPASCEVV